MQLPLVHFAALQLDRMILVPSADPPHKEGQVAATESRYMR